ncbi:MAG: DUF2971 domain-containing protein [Proteobacteria bacterium]|nr:DUF2971 domain-containing protein [Pseudomonadota bacterium]
MLYKYRSLENFKFVVDILVNSRLYAAKYSDLNDPMEGFYRYENGGLPDDLIKKIDGAKETIKLCSLSRNPDNPLMWAHYANGHRGFVVGVEVDIERYLLRQVKYEGPKYVRNISQRGDEETAIKVLCHKYKVWSYEEEERVFVSSGNYVDIELRKLILGRRMSTQDVGPIKKLSASICPNVEIVRPPKVEI